eukprot:SAG31_NODE_20312_length_578_cov_0.718163_1_plen_81_part_00
MTSVTRQDMDVYMLGARFLEKLRIKTKKPKSKKRKAIEADTQPGKKPFLGVDANGSFWAPAGVRLHKTKDELGRTIVAGF